MSKRRVNTNHFNNPRAYNPLDGSSTYRTTTYLAFWMESPLCNFWQEWGQEPAGCYVYETFSFDGHKFPNSEAAMMYQKAKLFKDERSIAHILAERSSPGMCKGLGRRVAGFDEGTWQNNRLTLVYDVLLAKFSQSEKLKQYLLGTKKLMLVEASPEDKLWGNGLQPSDPANGDRAAWLGLNLLGKVLEQVRHELNRREQSPCSS